jgi:hypothetical protein
MCRKRHADCENSLFPLLQGRGVLSEVRLAAKRDERKFDMGSEQEMEGQRVPNEINVEIIPSLEVKVQTNQATVALPSWLLIY